MLFRETVCFTIRLPPRPPVGSHSSDRKSVLWKMYMWPVIHFSPSAKPIFRKYMPPASGCDWLCVTTLRQT